MSKLEVDTIDTKTGTNSLTIKQNDTAAITIDTSQNVGIGTSSPATKLDIVSDSSARGIHIRGRSADNIGLIDFNSNDGATRYASIGSQSANTFSIETNNVERMRIDSSGRLLLGTTSQDGQVTVNYQSGNNGAKFTLTNSSSASNVLVFNNTNGTVGYIQTNGSSTSYNTSSDYRLKENVIDLADATTRVKQLQPKRFNFIIDADTTVDGFLAHEVSSIVPEAITGTHNEVDEEGNPVYQGIDQSKLVPLLTASLQEAIAKIEQLETRITALENA